MYVCIYLSLLIILEISIGLKYFSWSVALNKFNVLIYSTVFFTCHLLKNVVRVIEGKITKWPEGKWKLVGDSRRFELSKVWFTEGKITVNVWTKSARNRCWFELPWIRVSEGSSYRESTVCHLQLYQHSEDGAGIMPKHIHVNH